MRFTAVWRQCRPTKDNIIQETKRERLQRQRLSRVEQELRFLQECPSVVIVGDDRDEDEHDDCRSEISFATVASSTCSTRSGVISRHDFKCFLAQQKEISVLPPPPAPMKSDSSCYPLTGTSHLPTSSPQQQSKEPAPKAKFVV
ncbi:hypothetical protein GQ600_6451 [Phytophthora cactorum]|nr:hypothetical protein GQ600_6451 [Phytophthora cactorum]